MKYVKGYLWEITSHEENANNMAVVCTNRFVGDESGAARHSVVQEFTDIEEAKNFLKNQIGFIKNISMPDQDGFSLLYEGLGKEIVVSISKTALSVLDSYADTIQDLFAKINFEPLIESLSDDKELKEISINVDKDNNLAINYNLIYQPSELKGILKQ